MLTHKNIWDALDALAARYDLSSSGLARKAGLDPTAFNKSKRFSADGRERWPSTESVAKVLEATGATLDELAALMHPDSAPPLPPVHDGIPSGSFPPQNQAIPLLGFAQAGAGGFFDDGGFPVGQGWDVVEFPLGRAARPHCYALEVQGDSMMPLYRDGDIVIVEPGAQVRRGDRVVVRTKDGEVMVKTLSRRTARIIELDSINPDHATRTLENAEIDWIARIIWASQ